MFFRSRRPNDRIDRGPMTHATPAGSPRQRFRSRLAERPLLVDGGLGTLLFSRGVPQRAV